MDATTRIARLTSILDVARAMTVERDLDRLLTIIVEEAKRVVDADRCTIFVVDRDSSELWSRVAHGLGTREIRLPIGQGIAGHVALHDTVLHIDNPYGDARFDKAVDAATGYRTRSILAVPMRGPRGEVVGVLQALNPVRPDGRFVEDDEDLLLALGGQAAAAIQNTFLYEAIEELFEGLVRASIVAIESRDPATSGHSERVTRLTVALAQAVNTWKLGPYARTRFSAAELRELRFACMLHDMGKVGVREHVLVKANKLNAEQRVRIQGRLDLARAGLQRDYYRRLAELTAVDDSERERRRQQLVAELEVRLEEVDQIEALVDRLNEPVPLLGTDAERLEAMADVVLPDLVGESPWLEPDELALLQIRRGSLSELERREIESHVSHSYRFLTQIPWTADLSRVPELAWGHHEKLNGRGYPRGIGADDIAVGTRMMTIADIYDALTATDRPYKKALSHERALFILKAEAEAGAIDRDLLDIFIGTGVPERVLGLEPRTAATVG